MPDPSRFLRALVGALVWTFALAAPAAAQDEDALKVEGEIGASLFFGNTSQTTVTARAAGELADSTRELGMDGVFTYGEASDGDGESFVNKRSWSTGLSYDHHPLERLSPFAFGKLESSYEKRIELRYNLGAGAKLMLVRSERSRADFSWALLAERTNPADVIVDDPELFMRWSGRLRGRRVLGDGKVTLSSETFWRPRLDRIADFTLSTTNGLALRLNDRVSLKLTFLDSYDSEAEERGARSNNDGQLLFSVLSSF